MQRLKLIKIGQKLVENLSKIGQKVVKKWSKMVERWQKKIAKSDQKVVKNWRRRTVSTRKWSKGEPKVPKVAKKCQKVP